MMIMNKFAQQIIVFVFTAWPYEKAIVFQKHMEPILYNHKLSEQQTREWADKFGYLPDNEMIKRDARYTIKKVTYDQ